jgi:hypothetical protein
MSILFRISSLNIPSEAQCLFHLDLSNMADTNGITGALGSIIGYLGAEVAETSAFERLLWPARFYNVVSLRNLMELAFLMPMGGPLHKAALETLDVFRHKGLYGGMTQGHMLGTAFYADTKLTYRLHGYDGTDKDNEIRNGLWATVLQKCRHYKINPIPVMKPDPEAKGEQPQSVRRTTQVVRHLRLWRPIHGTEYEKVKVFCEDETSLKTFIAIFASEITALVCAVVIGWQERCFWFAAYLCIPLFLKLISVPLSVRREPASPSEGNSEAEKSIEQESEQSVNSGEGAETVIFEVSDYDHGFPLIEGPEPVVRQFFKHWGHPLRKNNRDRLREIAGIALVVAFVLFFPIGLLSMLWVRQPVQILWLSYQVYAIIVMHIMRFRGSNGRCRTEEGIAEEVALGRIVAFRSRYSGAIMAKLESTPVERISHGQAKVHQLIQSHAKSRLLKRGDSGDSQTTLCAELNDEMSKL